MSLLWGRQWGLSTRNFKLSAWKSISGFELGNQVLDRPVNQSYPAMPLHCVGDGLDSCLHLGNTPWDCWCTKGHQSPRYGQEEPWIRLPQTLLVEQHPVYWYKVTGNFCSLPFMWPPPSLNLGVCDLPNNSISLGLYLSPYSKISNMLTPPLYTYLNLLVCFLCHTFQSLSV